MSNPIEQLMTKVRLIVGRALFSAVNSVSGDDGLSVDISLAGGEKHTKVPLIQHYGLTSRPNKDAEAVVLFIGGARDNGIAIATQGKNTKIPSLEDGEVALFSEYGQTIILKKDGSIVATPKSGKRVRIESDMDVIGNINAFGKVNAEGEVSAICTKVGEDLQNATAFLLSKHMHPSATPGAPSTPTPGGA